MYRIRKGETISDVVARAGGLTPTAFPTGAIFTRESVAAQETSRAREFSQSVIRNFASSQLTREDNSVDIAEVQSIAEILQDFEGVGRLLVNIDNALGGDNLADIILEAGDTLTIPSRISTVTVVGEIRRPGTHSFQAGLDLNDYLGLSAGMTARADDKELYIVRADGSVFRPTKSWLRFDGAGASLNPGDTIVVPINAGYTDNLSLWREITQVIFNSTAGLASIVAATK
jgi:polysaccharide export outer membrane protein